MVASKRLKYVNTLPTLFSQILIHSFHNWKPCHMLSCLTHTQVPVNKFHELRYNVSYVLKEMEDLEKRNILKLQD